MDQPLGRTSGNALEIAESVELLQGNGASDLLEVTLVLAEEMLRLVGIDDDPRRTIEDGTALEKYRAMIKAQGGDPDAPLPETDHRISFGAPRAGYLRSIDARAVGVAAWRLGAGRARKEDPVSPTAGIVRLVEPGTEVAEGEPVLELHVDDPARLEGALTALEGALDIGPESPETGSLIIERISS
jgi:thymidine phosphorylase